MTPIEEFVDITFDKKEHLNGISQSLNAHYNNIDFIAKFMEIFEAEFENIKKKQVEAISNIISESDMEEYLKVMKSIENFNEKFTMIQTEIHNIMTNHISEILVKLKDFDRKKK
jgi:hypothetical protein